MSHCNSILAAAFLWYAGNALVLAQPLDSRVGNNDFIGTIITLVSDSAVAANVRGLELFGTRHAMQANRDEIVSWIQQKFLDVGIADVVVDSFQYATTWQKNIIATIPGTSAAYLEIVVGGHYDSQSSIPSMAPGADDNASGTSAVIEMARVLRAVQYFPKATLRFIAFGAEEMGLIGSSDYAAKIQAANRQIVLMQNYDMIGHRNQSQSDRNVKIVWYQGSEVEASMDSALKRTYTTLIPVLTTQYRPNSDSYPFFLRGYRAVFNIEDDFSPYYHTKNDTSGALDFKYASEIVQSGLALLLTIDGQLATTSVTKTSQPVTWRLEQNFPNPFNARTVIRYWLPVASKVKLTVTNLHGQRVAELVNGTQDAGWKEVFWTANVASGVYFYRLEAIHNGDVTGRFFDSRKMILVK
jgi:hypothetical protein